MASLPVGLADRWSSSLPDWWRRGVDGRVEVETRSSVEPLGLRAFLERVPEARDDAIELR